MRNPALGIPLMLSLLAPLLSLSAQTTLQHAPFLAHSVGDNITGGGQVLAIDVNKDGKPDLIAMGRELSQLVWFENPVWQRHVMMHGLLEMKAITAVDIDGDNVPEIVLAYGSGVALLQPFGDPRGIWGLRDANRISPQEREAIRNSLVPESGQEMKARWEQNAPRSPGEHALLAVDLNDDGNPEIVSASAAGSKNLYLYRAVDAAGLKWERMLLDDAMAATNCVAADFNGDNRMDVSCIDGTNPFSVRWYENAGR